MIVHSADGHGGTSAIVCFVLNALPLLFHMQRRRRVMTGGDDRNHRRDRACELSVIFSKMWESLWEGKKLLAAAAVAFRH